MPFYPVIRSGRFSQAAALRLFRIHPPAVFTHPRKDLPLTKSLPADDLAPNLWITLRERLDADGRPTDLERFELRQGGPDPEQDSEAEPSDENPTFMMRRRKLPVAPGTPLKILASSVPYIYVSVLAPDGDEAGPVILDVRKHPVVRLDDSVPEAIQRFARAQSRKARRQAAREVEEKAMQRAYLSQALKDVDGAREDDSADSESDGGDGSAARTPRGFGGVTDRRRGTGRGRQVDDGTDPEGRPEPPEPFDLM